MEPGLNLERMESFLSALPGGYRYAFEFRDTSWFHADVYRALAKHGTAFCIFELAGLQSPRELTADFTYIRLHGPSDAYSGSYTTEALAMWADSFSRWVKRGKEVYRYFDNNALSYAAQNAAQLQDLIGGRLLPPQ